MKRWRAAPETWFASSLQAILAVLAIAAAYQLCVSYGIGLPIKHVDAERAKLSTEIALAYASSWFFNLLVVLLPAFHRRRRIRRWLKGRYIALKDDLVGIYLDLNGVGRDRELIERLRDAQCFSDYFHERYSKDQTRWHAVHNGLYEYGIPEIRAHCQAFVSDCDLAVGLVGELTSEAARVLSQVRFIVLRSNVAEPEYDDIKALLMLLYPLHCPWSFLDGEIHKDRLLRDIERI